MMNGWDEKQHLDDDAFGAKGNIVSAFDAFPKAKPQYVTRTAGGGKWTVAMTVISVFLFWSELGRWWRGTETHTFAVEKGVLHEMQINMDIVVRMHCDDLHINVQDAAGDRILASSMLKRDKTNWSQWVDSKGIHRLGRDSKGKIDTGAGWQEEEGFGEEHVHDIVSLSKKRAKWAKTPRLWGDGDSCRIYGNLDVNRVQGDFHITARGHGYMEFGEHLDHAAFNFSHIISEMSFGPFYPSLVNPLDRTVNLARINFHKFQYYLSVVPTVYSVGHSSSNLISTNQYAVTEQSKETDDHNIPGIFFKYDIEPILLSVEESRDGFLQFLMKIVNVISGVLVAGHWGYTLTEWYKEVMGRRRRERNEGFIGTKSSEYDHLPIRRTFATAQDVEQQDAEMRKLLPKSIKPDTYRRLHDNLLKVRHVLGQQRLTLAEKILYSHLDNVEDSLLTNTDNGRNIRGSANLKLNPDRVNMQDASAQMALLQFMSCNLAKPAIPASIHCDHLIVGSKGAESDLTDGISVNKEVFDFLESAGRKYGMDFWPPGAGIIHQTVLEVYALPGIMMLGTDSHSPNAGGLSTITIGVGGADAVEALVGAPWELKAPRVLGVKLTGKLNDWVSPKDVILNLAGKLTVRGGTGFIVEYFGEGVETLSATGMATICNMGAEVGATTSIFPYTAASERYLLQTRRQAEHKALDAYKKWSAFNFRADEDAHYDQVIEINLSELEPHINGPFTPDLATPLSAFKETIQTEQWPEVLSAGLIGSCTNSSYEDMTKVESMVKQAEKAGLKPKAPFYITPGSEQIRATLERDGTLKTLEGAGGIVLSNACGPCIGQWKRQDDIPKGQLNAILTSYNRNFKGRNDGNPGTMNFLASPEIVTAMAYAGATTFNPMTDKLQTPDGKEFKFEAPRGLENPKTPFESGVASLQSISPDEPNADVKIAIAPTSERLAFLEPFAPFPESDLSGLKVLVKVTGKCTTDTISAAGPWLKYKGHLPNISTNTLNTAVNKETGEVNAAYDVDGSKHTIPELAQLWKERGQEWLVVAEHNYGEGSAREHAALQPRYLGARVVLTKSFARIHETNLKKQGVVPLTFENEADYDKIAACDEVSTVGLYEMLQNGGQGKVQLLVKKKDGSEVLIPTSHAVTKDQAGFILAGSALSMLAKRNQA
ncbi:aconitate hydratase [Colletotrichum abscissum]|uniref:Aconitate hydratase n=1 Tax=Colletotrichum abscissum TaxID=1671311 RepID=A0A9P9X710_9PEZI|nr:aconitate hydratase [Colletotrichum abscissum]KAI3538193.1 aconitate hydratase [Colletotrichum abscissum]KAI3542481.1 aconitate hydratase [Colletotrichum filicis]KAK1496033.1 aconitate hydratase [Colletotrichum abscissum]